MSYIFELDLDNPLAPLQAASFTYPIALWPHPSLKGLISIESGESSPNSARLTATRGGDTVAGREKGGIKTLYVEFDIDIARAATTLRSTRYGTLP